MPRFGSNIDVNGNQILNFRVQVLTADPGSPTDGQMWYRSDTGVLNLRMGSNTRSFRRQDVTIVNADIDAAASIAESKLNLATDAAAGTGSRRTLGTGSTQAFPGNGRHDQLAAPTADVAWNSQKITGLADPVSAQDAATKNYVDVAVTGLDWKNSVRAASTANLSLTGTQTVDGVALIANDRILVKDQTTGGQNGIYVVAAGAWARATDNDTAAEMVGAVVPVEEGTVNADKIFLQTVNAPITLGTTTTTWTQLSSGGTTYTGGTGITVTGSSIAIENSGVLLLTHGGTGATTAAGARTAIGAVTKFAADITGNGSATQFTVTHSLGTKDVQVQVWDPTDDFWVITDIFRVDTNSVRIDFSAAPANAKVYRVIVMA